MPPIRLEGENGPGPEDAERDWTVFTNHGHVLICIALNTDVRVRDIAATVGVTERCVMQILGDLERAGYLTRSRVGRRNRYTIRRNRSLRRPFEELATIGDVLDAATADSSRDPSSRPSHQALVS
jgi:DNA-binding MarR family transcriptional regulator